MPRYANMSDAEAEAWERGGGVAAIGGAGVVYDPLREQQRAAGRIERERRAEERRTASAVTAQEKLDERERRRVERAARPAVERPARQRNDRLFNPRVYRANPEALITDQARDWQSPTHNRIASDVEHGTLRAYLAGCHCLDCTNAANEAAMLGEWKP